MIPEFGHFALILALCVSLVLGILPLVGAHTRHAGWIAIARPAAGAMNLALLAAFHHVTRSSYAAGLAATVAASLINFFVLKRVVFTRSPA